MSEKFSVLMAPRIFAMKKGYDAYYLKFNVSPGNAYWIRYDLSKIKNNLSGELWFIRFSNGRPDIYLKKHGKVEYNEEKLVIGAGELHETSCVGEIGDISWDIKWRPIVKGFPYYKESFLTRKLPTKAVASYPSLRVSGKVIVRGEEFQFNEFPGEIGHHWGKYHQKNWFYYHGNAFAKPCMVIGAGTKRIGRVLNIMYYHDGNKLYGLDSLRAAISKGKGEIEIDSKGGIVRAVFSAEFDKKLNVEFSISAPFDRIIGVTYADPKGPVYCYNSMVADGKLTVRRENDVEELSLPGGAAFEIGTRKKIKGLKIFL